MTTFKNKTVATTLAALFGSIGLHRFYLNGTGSWRAWCYPLYFIVVGSLGLHYLAGQHSDLFEDPLQMLHPALLVALVPTFAGFIEALVFALTPDAKWDSQWNQGTGRESDSNWMVIVIAILTLAIGATALMSVLAISLQRYYEAQAESAHTSESQVTTQPNKSN